MKSLEYDRQIEVRQRRSIEKVLTDRGLRVAPLCEAAGVAEGTLRNFLSDYNHAISAVIAQKIADKAGVTIQQLLCGIESDIIPISGCIKNGAKIQRGTSEATKNEIIMLSGAEHAADAEIFRIQTSPPSLDDGALVIFENKRVDRFDDFIGKRILVKIRNGEELVKILHAGNKSGRYNLHAFGMTGDQSHLIENAEIEWCALVKQIIWA